MLLLKRPEMNISYFRHERPFIVVRREVRNPLINISKSLECKVGGFLGIGKKESTSRITLDKDQFFPGETIYVKIQCDNSKCSKAVKGFKSKIQRSILALGYEGRYTKSKKYVAVFKS